MTIKKRKKIVMEMQKEETAKDIERIEKAMEDICKELQNKDNKE